MKLRFVRVFPGFFFGLSLQPRHGYYALGLGWFAVNIDRSLDNLESHYGRKNI